MDRTSNTFLAAGVVTALLGLVSSVGALLNGVTPVLGIVAHTLGTALVTAAAVARSGSAADRPPGREPAA